MIPQRDVDLELIDRAREAEAHNNFVTALAYLDLALQLAETPHARWNRSQILLALGDYPAGLEDAEARWQLWPNLAGEQGGIAAARAPLWNGENISGRSLLLYHEQGYGDTIMLLRYVPIIRDMGADVTLLLPASLHRLADQFANVRIVEHCWGRFDFRCPMFSILRALGATRGNIPPAPYLKANNVLQQKWRRWCKDRKDGPVIGVAWSGGGAGYISETERSIPKDKFLGLLAVDDDQVISLQQGVHFHFDDFADVAALASVMDEIVSVDTAALHIAGAIGHPNTYGMLRHQEIWRWRNPRWYPQLKLCRQDRPGNWASAFGKMH